MFGGEFEDIKWAIRIRKLKDRKYNCQEKKGQTTIYNTKDPVTRTTLKTRSDLRWSGRVDSTKTRSDLRCSGRVDSTKTKSDLRCSGRIDSTKTRSDLRCSGRVDSTKTRNDLRCCGRVDSTSSISGIRRVTLKCYLFVE